MCAYDFKHQEDETRTLYSGEGICFTRCFRQAALCLGQENPEKNHAQSRRSSTVCELPCPRRTLRWAIPLQSIHVQKRLCPFPQLFEAATWRENASLDGLARILLSFLLLFSILALKATSWLPLRLVTIAYLDYVVKNYEFGWRVGREGKFTAYLSSVRKGKCIRQSTKTRSSLVGWLVCFAR